MRRHLFLALFGAAALLVPTTPAGAAPAADTTPPQIRSIELSRTAVTVSGLQTVLVDVRVRLTDETGVEPRGDGVGGHFPYVAFDASLNQFANLERTGGTPQDGIWTGQVAVTSAWQGMVTVKHLGAYDMAHNLLEVDPRTVLDPVGIDVRSSHRPALEMTFPAEPATRGKPVVMRVRVWDTETGRPWPKAPLVVGNDNGCVETTGSRINAYTDGAGIHQRTLSVAEATALNCAWVPGTSKNPVESEDYRTIIAIDAAHVRYSRYKVGATPARTTAPAGTSVDVNGSAAPANTGKVIRLQRYTGGAWKNVNTGQVRKSGRYTVVATPPGKGSYSYRVYAPGDGLAVGGTSKAFTIRGT